MRGRGHARRPVDGEADHIGSARLDLAGVQAHLDAGHAGGPRLGGQGTLRVDGRGNGVAGTAEDDEEGIASVPCSWPLVGLEGRAVTRWRSSTQRYGPVPPSSNAWTPRCR